MPTLDELRSAFTELEERAPVTCGAHGRRRSRLPMLAAAAVVVAVAVAATMVVARTPHTVRAGSPAPTATMTSPTIGPSARYTQVPTGRAWDPTAYHFSVRVPAGLVLQYVGSDVEQQTAELDTAAGEPYATVNVYAAGQPAPRRPAGARAVTVNGAPGYEAALEPTLPGMVATSDGPELTAVAWNAGTGWNVVQVQPVSDGRSHPDALAVARSVELGADHDVLVPARIRYLPSGFSLRGVFSSLSSGVRRTGLELVGGRARTDLTITVATGGTGGGDTASLRGVPIAFDGWSGNYDRACGSLWVRRDGVDVSVQVPDDYEPLGNCVAIRSHVLDRTTLERIVTGLGLAARPADPATWFAAGIALPR